MIDIRTRRAVSREDEVARYRRFTLVEYPAYAIVEIVSTLQSVGATPRYIVVQRSGGGEVTIAHARTRGAITRKLKEILNKRKN